MINTLWVHRYLMLELAKRDVISRYKGSMFGLLWSFATPLIMLMIYTFLFRYVFKSNWHGASVESDGLFAVLLFAGLINYNFFSDCIVRAPILILNHVNFVKKIIFPIEILPCVVLLSALFNFAINIIVLLIFQFILFGLLPFTVFLIPFVMIPFILLTVGLCWFLAALGVYLRDINQTVGLALTGIMFLSPIFFPISALPEKWQFIARMNPLVFPIEQSRNVLIYNKYPEWNQWIIYFSVTTLFAWMGLYFFRKLKNGFADVL
jgi:lipopolysaccharide transport system permease protein